VKEGGKPYVTDVQSQLHEMMTDSSDKRVRSCSRDLRVNRPTQLPITTHLFACVCRWVGGCGCGCELGESG
jgi:hypothetical protein